MTSDLWEDPRLYEDLGESGDRVARRELLKRLCEAGVSRDRLLRAVKEERVAALPAELALGVGHVGERVARLSDGAMSAATAPVQVVKTIGDAVMLASPRVAELLDVLIALLQAWEKQPAELPELRAGLAYGPAVTRAGDWFGAPVNLASRLTDAAKPGTINVAAETQEEVADRYDWDRRKRKGLKGVGRTAYFRIKPEAA